MARSSKSRCQQGHAPSPGSRGGFFLASPALWWPHRPLACAHHSSLPLCLHTAFVLVSVSFSVSCKDILIGCRAQPNPLWSHLNSSLIVSEVKVTQLCPTLCDPMNYTAHGILQARILEWVAFSSKGSSQPRDRTQVFHIAGGFFTSWGTKEAQEYWSGYAFSSWSSWPRNRTNAEVSCIAGEFFTTWAYREALIIVSAETLFPVKATFWGSG